MGSKMLTLTYKHRDLKINKFCVHVYICVYRYLCVFTYVCVSVFAHLHVSLVSVCVHVSVSMCAHACLSVGVPCHLFGEQKTI